MARRTIITTVVTPAVPASASAGAYDLTTLAVVKAELGITDGNADSILRRYITMASAAIANFCNRVFQVEIVKDEFWLACATPSPLQLSRFPVIADGISAVLENGVALVIETDFRADYLPGQLIRLDGGGYPTRWPVLAISAQYSAGFATLPPPVVEASIRMVKAAWLARGRDPMLRQENIPGVREATYWIATGADAGNMSPDVIDLINDYRGPTVA